jgi:hypothetical protein
MLHTQLPRRRHLMTRHRAAAIRAEISALRYGRSRWW